MDEVDWRKNGLVTAAKDQGGHGYCGTFGRVAAAEGQFAKHSGHGVSIVSSPLRPLPLQVHRSLRRMAHNEDALRLSSYFFSSAGLRNFSEEELVDCIGWDKDQFSYFKVSGFEDSAEYPYNTTVRVPHLPTRAKQSAISHSVRVDCVGPRPGPTNPEQPLPLHQVQSDSGDKRQHVYQHDGGCTQRRSARGVSAPQRTRPGERGTAILCELRLLVSLVDKGAECGLRSSCFPACACNAVCDCMSLINRGGGGGGSLWSCVDWHLRHRVWFARAWL